MHIISLPPNATVLMESTRSIGYSLETAIADVIDNSLAAKANIIKINFFPIGIPYVAILDNGIGMGDEDLINAMRYGSKNPLDTREATDLGRFGLGLKTASMSQCRRLTVVSKKDGKMAGAQWDLDFIASTNDWSLQLLESDEIDECPFVEQLRVFDSGTLVLWQELDRMKAGEINFDHSMGKHMDDVRDHISLVYHRYITGEIGIKSVEISINNKTVEPVDPFLIGKSTQVMDDEIINIDGHKVNVRPYTLPHISKLSEIEISSLGGEEGLRKLQGFYVYRNKRLLVWGTWFRMMRQGDLSKLARVRVDVPNSLDYLWTLDIKKSTAVPPEVVRKNLRAIIEKIAESSKKTWTFRGKKETDETKVHMWNRIKTRQGGILYEINREHPLVQAIDESGKKSLEQLLSQIERGLPLNQLYVDLTSDERITNENEMSKADVLELLKQLLIGCNSDAEREGMLSRLLIAEPFNSYADWISEVMLEAN